MAKRISLTKKNSTRAERIVAQALRELRIPFEHRVFISTMEVDFLVGDYVIELDGHKQNSIRNTMFVRRGYKPVHLSNNQVTDLKSTKIWLQTLLTKTEQS